MKKNTSQNIIIFLAVLFEFGNILLFATGKTDIKHFISMSITFTLVIVTMILAKKNI